MALSDNVIAAYHFDTSPGLLVDSSPSAWDLTNNNSVTSGTGKLAQDATMARSSSQYLSKSAEAGMDVSDLTVSFWVKFASFADYEACVSRWNEAGAVRSWAITCFSDGKLYVYNSSDGSGNAYISSTALSTGVWYHIVVVYDSSDAVTGKRIYINGSLDTSGAMSGIKTGTSTALQIGNAVQFGGTTAYFDGQIDEVDIWSVALTGSDVTTLYNGGSGLAYPFSASTSIKTINGLAIASVKTVQGLAIASVKTWNGLA